MYKSLENVQILAIWIKATSLSSQCEDFSHKSVAKTRYFTVKENKQILV